MRQGGDVFVVDFGLAKPLGWEESLSASGRIMGTLPYMSPEQAEGRVAGPAADVYSLGATLYRLAAGRPPVRAGNVMELIARLQRREIDPPRRANPAVPPALEAVILEAMEDESRRYASAAELAEDLDRFLRGEPVSARPPGTLAVLGRSIRRNPLMIWATALLLAVLLWFALFGASTSARVESLVESADRKSAAADYEGALRVVAQNKVITSQYRAVGHPIAAAVTESMLDLIARDLGLDPAELRRRNLIRPDELPWTSVTGNVYDSGSYQAALARLLEVAHYDDLRREQAAARREGRCVGIGLSCFVELTGLWVAFDGSPYRKPRISKERRKRLDRMKAENLARLKELMKLPRLDRINRPGKRG